MRCIVFALLAVSASAENFSKPLNNEKQQSIEFNERNTTILSAEFVEHVQRALGQGNGSPITDFNPYVDQILKLINDYMSEWAYDPFKIPAIQKQFSFSTLLGTIDVLFAIADGTVSGISSLHRTDDCVVLENEDKKIYLEMNVGLHALTANTNYKAKLVGMGPSGSLEVVITKVRLGAAVTLNFFGEPRLTLEELKLVKRKELKINIKLSGNNLLDWVVNIISNAAVTLLKPLILERVFKIIQKMVYQIIHDLNAGSRSLPMN